MRLRFILPLPPSVNHQYSHRHGRWVLSTDAQVYKRTLAKALAKLRARGVLKSMMQECPGAANGVTTDDGNSVMVTLPMKLQPNVPFLSIRYEFFLESSGRRDIDNGIKIVQDALCNGLGVDDRHVVEIYIAKRVDRNNPRLVVTIEALSFWDMDGDRSLFRKPEPADHEFDLLNVVRRHTPKRHKSNATSLSSLEQLMERFKWS